MSQRDSGYERKERDLYETPEWVTLALVPHLPRGEWAVWEPACGGGKMIPPLRERGYSVTATDIEDGTDFLLCPMPSYCHAIITNPPYAIADEFVERALAHQQAKFIAFLLRTDFDHAKTRRCYFADCGIFAKKVVLTRRIKWFEDSAGSPSFNHAWFIWSRRHQGAPTLAYGP